MHLRPAIFVATLLMAGMSASLGAEEVAADAAAERPRLGVFTETEMARFWEVAAELAAKRETYIRRSEDDEIIELEPYIVEGDNSLWRARIRRALERSGSGTRRRFFLGLAPEIQRELLFARQSQDAFFSAGSPGRPHDAPNFNGIDLLRLPQKLRPENWRGLFRAPATTVGE